MTAAVLRLVRTVPSETGSAVLFNRIHRRILQCRHIITQFQLYAYSLGAFAYLIELRIVYQGVRNVSHQVDLLRILA